MENFSKYISVAPIVCVIGRLSTACVTSIVSYIAVYVSKLLRSSLTIGYSENNTTYSLLF
jgi:hypothetical protein